MASIRQKQAAETIRRHFGTLLQQEGRHIYGPDPFVTVTEVQLSPDYSLAKIYLSVFNTENKPEIIRLMEGHDHRLKQALATRIGRKIRRMPDIRFYLDDTVDEMYRVEELLKRIGPAPSEEEE